MGHKCCSKQKVKRGLWSPEEDEKLLKHITTHGHGSWSSVPKFAGLQRCGKSCRLRWINYLRPDLKRGAFTQEEEQIIIDVHRILGNRWAQIAKHLPGRTDNEVKNFWNSCIKKKLMSQGLDPKTHNLIPSRKRPSTCKNNNYKIEFTISQPQSQFHQKPTNANSYSQAMTTNDVSMEITRQPVLTFPSPPPNSISNGTHQPSLTHPIPNSESQNPNFFWNACAQNSQDSPFFSNVSPVDAIPISSNSIDPSGFGLLDENYSLSGTENNTILQPFEPPIIRIKGSQHQGQEQQEKGNVCEIQVDKNDEPMGSIARDMDSSFDSSGFDFEFMDSGLISDSMYRDLSSVDDFAWNF